MSGIGLLIGYIAADMTIKETLISGMIQSNASVVGVIGKIVNTYSFSLSAAVLNV